MCELLVRVVDKVNEDPVFDALCTKRGDVIVVAGDGWPWGKEELTSTSWRIVKAPGVKVSDAANFLGPELATGPDDASLLARRAFSIDLDKMPATGVIDSLSHLQALRINKRGG